MFNKTINRTSSTTHNEADTVYTVLNAELQRMHEMMANERSSYGVKDGVLKNINIFWNKIQELQKILMLCAEKGADEDVKKQLRDLQKNAVESIILGNKQ